MELNCSLVEDLFPLYTEDQLKPENRKAIEAHIEHCESCRSLYQNFTDGPVLPAFSKNQVEQEADDRIRWRFRLQRMKLVATLLAVILIVTGINRYTSNREKVADLMNSMYLYSRELNEMAKNPYESNQEMLSYAVEGVIDLSNELNWLERHNRGTYHAFVDSQPLQEMTTKLKERQEQGLADETDQKAIESLQEQTSELFTLVKKEYSEFHHGYSSYFELLNTKGIGKEIEQIEELAYVYTAYHQVPADLPLIKEQELKEIVKKAFQMEKAKITVEDTLNENPGVAEFNLDYRSTSIHGKIDGYTGNLLYATNDSVELNHEKPQPIEKVTEKAEKMLAAIYGDQARFDIQHDSKSEAAISQPDVYRFRYTPVFGPYKMIFPGSEPPMIEFDAATGEFLMLSATHTVLFDNLFSKTFQEKLSKEELIQLTNGKAPTTDKGIIYSNISSNFVLVQGFEGEDNINFINLETGVKERNFHN